MSKNLTRKGLAFGAIVALGTSLFAGAPAQAADEVTIASNAGTGNTTILGEAFTVKATLGATISSSAYDDLKFKVTNDTNAVLTYTAETTSQSGTTRVDGTNGTASGGTSDVVYEYDATASSTASTGTLAVSSAATAGHTVSVVAFLDTDGGDDLDASEFQSAPLTITYVKAADAALTTTWNAQLGDAKVQATVKSSVVNVAQIASGHVLVKFGQYVAGTKKSVIADNTAYGNTSTLAAAINADKDARVTPINSTNGDVIIGSDTALTAGAFVARAVYYDGTNYTDAGAEIAFSLGAAEAVQAESEYEVVASENVTSQGVVRKSFTGDVVYKATVADVDGVLLAGKTVRLTTGTSDSAGTFKVNGVTAADATGYTAVTNASGVATFTVTNSSGVAGNTFAVASLTVDGVVLHSAINSNDNATDLEWTAASYTVFEKAVYSSSNYDRGVTGSSTTLTYVALDQWKKALTGADYRIKFNLSSATVGAPADTFADGSASITITDGGLDTTNYKTVVDPVFEEYVSSAWTTTESTIAAVSDPHDLNINFYASQTDKVALEGVKADGTDTTGTNGSLADSVLSGTIAAKKTAAVDTSFANVPAVFAPVGTDADRVLLTGEVTNAATAAPKKGALVTVSGDSSILFQVGTAWAFGSLTFNADADGTFTIAAYSNKAQSDSAVTVTSNGVSKKALVEFTASTAQADVTKVLISAPATLLPGRSVAVTFTAVDKYGNAVNLGGDYDDITITLTGAGYLTSYPTVFTKGVANVTLITQPNDTGSAVLKIVAALGSSIVDKSATATVTIGAAPVVAPVASAAVAGSTGKFYVSATAAAGKSVVVKVAGKFVTSFKATGSKKTVAVKATKGSKKVTVYVGGKLTATKTVTVK